MTLEIAVGIAFAALIAVSIFWPYYRPPTDNKRRRPNK